MKAWWFFFSSLRNEAIRCPHGKFDPCYDLLFLALFCEQFMEFLMTIYPAIDLRGGKCVRLFQGLADQQTTYFEDPSNLH